jgi:hypothetical protein
MDRRYHRDQDHGRAPDYRGSYRRASSYNRTSNRPKAYYYICQKEDY